MVGAHTLKILDRLRTSYWFIPALMTAASAGMAWLGVRADRRYEFQTPWLYAGDADGARSLLSMIAGSMITVAGVTFSITIVALSLASSQFGPRLLRNYLRDRVEQLVLGTFLATFTFALLVLRTVRTENPEFVPHLSVTVTILLAMSSLAVLIYFIHHIAVTIQAPVIVADVGRELRRAIRNTFPDRDENPPDLGMHRSQSDGVPERFEAESCPVRLKRGGYVQAFDSASLFALACKHDLLIAMRCRPGDFLSPHDDVCRVWPASKIDGDILRAVRRAIIHGEQRTLIQDVRFAIAQLVEVSAISLSPGVNEPFTAISCIHWLSDALALAAGGRPANPLHYENGKFLRVVYQGLLFRELLDDAFDPIRRMAAPMPTVMDALMEGYLRIAPNLRRQEDRNHLFDHARRALIVAEEKKRFDADVLKQRRLYAELLELLQDSGDESDATRPVRRHPDDLTGEARPEQ